MRWHSLLSAWTCRPAADDQQQHAGSATLRAERQRHACTRVGQALFSADGGKEAHKFLVRGSRELTRTMRQKQLGRSAPRWRCSQAALRAVQIAAPSRIALSVSKAIAAFYPARCRTDADLVLEADVDDAHAEHSGTGAYPTSTSTSTSFRLTYASTGGQRLLAARPWTASTSSSTVGPLVARAIYTLRAAAAVDGAADRARLEPAPAARR